jgi:mono/diheme cytochrome c family protein
MKNFILSICIASILMLSSCSTPDRNNPGTEYMPDMYHSIAYEANLNDYYYYNTWGTEKEYTKLAQPRKPVAGTIARGYVAPVDKKFVDGSATTNAIAVPVNGSVPYYYEDTEEERTRAMKEIIKNPFPITEAGLKSGEELYNTFCGICHGKKGDGNGWLVDEKNTNQVYPAQPANFLSELFLEVGNTNGRYYHSIMHGKNVMGAYADKISYEERWNVIHWIRALQAKATDKEYNEMINTLNDIDVPYAQAKQITATMNNGTAMHSGGSHHVNGQHIGMHHSDGMDHSGGMHAEGTHNENGVAPSNGMQVGGTMDKGGEKKKDGLIRKVGKAIKNATHKDGNH